MDFALMRLLPALDGLAQLLVALLPLAIWQRTRVAGFAIVAASYLAGALMLLVAPTVFGVAGGGMGLLVAWRLLGLVVTGVAAFGFWRIYRALRVAPAAGGG